MTVASLTLDVRSDWQAATGRGAGYFLDALVHRDAAGLPCLPGRTVKGLLRDAVSRAEHFGWLDAPAGLTERLFGVRDGVTTPGALRVSNAGLPPHVQRFLATDGAVDLRAHLFRTVYSTAIDHDTGSASDHSLRGVEVAVPLELTATIEQLPGTPVEDDWVACVRQALPLLGALGAQRNRGYGRVQCRLEVPS